jgi:PTH1 family peptidyl-tRNA hydrolase
LVVGLGNPGSEYEHTRHNVGFLVVDALCKKLKIRLRPGSGDYFIGFGRYHVYEVGLVKPTTYMNNSGIAVSDVVQRYGTVHENLLVVSDDANLPLGEIRLRESGSDGGHNGLASVIYHLLSNEFPRLRCGVGAPAPLVDASKEEKKQQMIQFVLSPFEKEEIDKVSTMVERAAEAALCFISNGVVTAMNRFNS